MSRKKPAGGMRAGQDRADAERADVLVVGAGVAGTVTAAALAARGVRVLLAGTTAVAPAADYDLMLSDPARHGLARIGAHRWLPARPLEAIDLRVGEDAGQSVTDAQAAVCTRAGLLGALHRAAFVAGARTLPGLVTALERTAGGFDAASGPAAFAVRHVVLATGSVAAGIPVEVEHRRDVHIHVRRLECAAPDGRMLLTLASTANERPACAWRLPGPGDPADGATPRAVTIGIAVMGDPAGMLDRAVASLHGRGGRPIGPVIRGVLDCGYAPDRVAGAEYLLVGDAAGLANPFTGEGLSYAVSSGLLAADAIAASLGDPDEARRVYARRLAARFAGYFETARHAERRYHLTWRVLSSTAGSDRLFFAKARRTILLPDRTAAPPWPDDAFLLACDEAELSLIRAEWPFLARMIIEGGGSRQQGMRPALLFLAGLLSSGRTPGPGHATAAAAVELAHYGALAFLSQAPVPAGEDRGVDWVSATTVLAGDFLISQASRLAAESGAAVSWSFADWLAEVTSLRAARLDQGNETVPGDMFASLFEFPARLGAVLGGAPPGTVSALREAGRQCGHAYLLAEEVLALRGQRTRLDTTLTTLIRDRVSGLSGTVLTDPAARTAALAGAVAGCQSATALGLEAVARIPHARAAGVLREFLQAVASPIEPAGAAPVLSRPPANHQRQSVHCPRE